MQVKGLDEDCRTCGRRTGDHTLDEWAVCFGAATTDLPYEQVDETEAGLAKLRERLGLDGDVQFADNVICRAITFGARSGLLDTKIPALLIDFETSGGGQLEKVASIVYTGDPETMRKFGKLIRDSARGAANAAER